MGVLVGPYFIFPSIGFPFTQCLIPINHKFSVSVDFTVVARIDYKTLTPFRSVFIVCAFVKTLYMTHFCHIGHCKIFKLQVSFESGSIIL